MVDEHGRLRRPMLLANVHLSDQNNRNRNSYSEKSRHEVTHGTFACRTARGAGLDFIGAVILLIQHSEEQAFGVIVNRPTTTAVKEAWKGKRRCQCEGMVYSGGPVTSPLMARHADEPLADLEVLPGVYYSVKAKQLDELFRCARHPLKVFHSHVGWGPGQLDDLLKAVPWRILPATPAQIFQAGPGLWEEVSTIALAQPLPRWGLGT